MKPSKIKIPDSNQIQFNFDGPKLPPRDEFPTNIQEPKTLHFVERDFQSSQTYTIITGFSSLEFLLYFFTKETLATERKTHVVLGHEDLRADRIRRMPKFNLSQEIIDYWLEQRISVEHVGSALHLITLIESKKVEFRVLQRLHAKIYLGDKHAIIGSSNFSSSGLKYQREGNVLVGREHAHYEKIKQVATYYYDESYPFDEQLIKLLRQLLKKVSWQEAMARSIALLIEGDWWKEFRELEGTLKGFNLWPTQEQAIGQALYILDNHGSVLIADPTGSGKTRLGSALHLALLHRLWASGRSHMINELLLVPPRVMDNWQSEYLSAHSNFNSIISHGTLSSGSEDSQEKALQAMLNAHILMIDEAHNFINKYSNRSKGVAKSLAEHIILFTATPINRKREDLFRIIELLDVDNFPDEVIDLYRRYAFRKKQLRGQELKQFQQVLKYFVVRRTKRELNRMIEKAPQKYHNRLGVQCKYPRQVEETYALQESEADIKIARAINALADQLEGITRLQNLDHINARHMSKEEQEDFFSMRVKSSAALAKYMIQDMMRSSTAALLEHVYGTKVAADFFNLKKLPANKNTGDTLKTIKSLHKPPGSNLDKIMLPDWVNDSAAYQKKCEEEYTRYQEIGKLAKQLSQSRERSKKALLEKLLTNHERIIAFDRHIISLFYLNTLFRDAKLKCLLVTGEQKKSLKDARKIFGLESAAKNYIGLFSDAMSEGVNLQGASAMVFLDMPSVVRLAEQRIGRIDRMDSQHEKIEIYWPDDHEEFALKTDAKFFKTADDVENLIGSNFRVPEKLVIIKGKEAIKLRKEALIEKEEEMEALLPDAFQAVEDLVTGESAIIDEVLYEKIRHSQARFFANVSIVESEASWAFFALEGAAQHAPRWLFIDEKMKIHQDLPTICNQLRTWLARSQNVDDWSEKHSDTFQRYVAKLRNSQIEQLPAKKRRAIHLLQYLLSHYRKDKDIPHERTRVVQELEELLMSDQTNEFHIDYDHFGMMLIRFFQPFLQDLRTRSPRKVFTINNLKNSFKQKPIATSQLQEFLDSAQFVRGIERRITACVVGVG